MVLIDEKPIFKIYFIVNQINGKIYIGRTYRSLETRWKEHLNDAKKGKYYFNKAIRKYGKNNFEMRAIDQTEDERESFELEILYIKFFRSYDSDFGYNSSMGGEGAGIPNAATRAKLSKRSRGKNHPLWGTHRPQHVKDALSKFHTGIGSPVYRHDVVAEEVARLYLEGKSTRVIGNLLNTDSKTVLDRLKVLGIARRPRWCASFKNIHKAQESNWRNNKNLEKPKQVSVSPKEVKTKRRMNI